MIAELYFQLFVAICIGLITWGLIHNQHIYQYPFFMGVINVIFVLPQAFALINNPGVVSQTALERVLLMASLCAAMCWIGYSFRANDKLLNDLDIQIDNDKLLKVAIFLTLIGWIFSILTNIEAAKIAGRNFTGPVVIYIFFAQGIYLGFSIFLFMLLKQPSLINFAGTFIAVIPILKTILIGRRQPIVTFLVIVGVIFWIVRLVTPPRWLVGIFLVLGIYLIPVIGTLRDDFWLLILNQDWETLISASQNSLNSLLEGNILELRNAALLMDSVDYSGNYKWGAGYWDALVAQYVPRQFVGEDFKNLLTFDLQHRESISQLNKLYGYQRPSGTTITGIGDSYLEFGYFGSLVFALIGYLFKNLWISSTERKSIISLLLMVGLISPAMLTVTHDTGGFLKQLLFQITVVSLIAYYARFKPSIEKPNKK